MISFFLGRGKLLWPSEFPPPAWRDVDYTRRKLRPEEVLSKYRVLLPSDDFYFKSQKVVLEIIKETLLKGRK